MHYTHYTKPSFYDTPQRELFYNKLNEIIQTKIECRSIKKYFIKMHEDDFIKIIGCPMDIRNGYNRNYARHVVEYDAYRIFIYIRKNRDTVKQLLRFNELWMKLKTMNYQA